MMRHVLMDEAGDGTGAGGGGGTGDTPYDWSTLPDPAVKTWVLAKGFKDPAAVAQSAWNQEKLLGVPADQIVKLPKDDNAEAWGAVYDRLGRPKEAKDYGLPVPEGDKGEFAAVAATWFHEAGLSARQARAVAEKWNAHVAGVMKAQADAGVSRETEEAGKLKADWGPKFDANVKLVDKAAESFGMTVEQLTALKTVMGPSSAMKFMHAIGSKLGVEGDFVTGGAGGGMTNFNTPEAALARIDALRQDKGFVARFAAGDVDARGEMRRLHEIAYPGDTQL